MQQKKDQGTGTLTKMSCPFLTLFSLHISFLISWNDFQLICAYELTTLCEHLCWLKKEWRCHSEEKNCEEDTWDPFLMAMLAKKSHRIWYPFSAGSGRVQAHQVNLWDAPACVLQSEIMDHHPGASWCSACSWLLQCTVIWNSWNGLLIDQTL